MSFSNYYRAKDKACFHHAGYSSEYLVQFKIVRESVEAVCPGVLLQFAAKEHLLHWLYPGTRLPEDELPTRRGEYSHVFNVSYDPSRRTNPLADLLDGVPLEPVEMTGPSGATAYICVEGDRQGTKPATNDDVRTLRKFASRHGLTPVVVGNGVCHSDLSIDIRPTAPERQRLAGVAGMVLGVECDMLYEAIWYGVPTALLPTGPGTNFYRSLTNKPVVL